MKRSCLLFWVS